MHEIVTLQFGSQSNYLGTHFWNAQVSPSCFKSTSFCGLFTVPFGLLLVCLNAQLRGGRVLDLLRQGPIRGRIIPILKIHPSQLTVVVFLAKNSSSDLVPGVLLHLST